MPSDPQNPGKKLKEYCSKSRNKINTLLLPSHPIFAPFSASSCMGEATIDPILLLYLLGSFAHSSESESAIAQLCPILWPHD